MDQVPKKQKSAQPYKRIIDSILEKRDDQSRALAFTTELIDIYEMDLRYAEVDPEDVHESELYNWNTFDFMRDCIKSGIFNNEVLLAVENELDDEKQNQCYRRHLAYLFTVISFLNDE